MPKRTWEPLPLLGVAYCQDTGAVLCIWRHDDSTPKSGAEIIQYVHRDIYDSRAREIELVQSIAADMRGAIKKAVADLRDNGMRHGIVDDLEAALKGPADE